MEILEQYIKKCDKCGKHRGHVIEKYNGLVPVWCRCDLMAEPKKEANPCMIFCEGGENGSRLIWKPISDNVDENGTVWHTPYFAGPSSW